MPDDCIFCKIASGKIPSHKVYEDGAAFAFLDIKPLARGHTLVIPKQHHVRLEDMTADGAASLMRAVHAVAGSVPKGVGGTGATVAINNGRDAGQEVQHIHVHVVPRFAGDGFGPIHWLFRGGKSPAAEDLAALARRVQAQRANA